MKSQLLLLAVLGCVATQVCAQPDETPRRLAAPLPLSPAQQIERTVRGFVGNINRLEMLGAQEEIAGARRGWFGANVWIQEFALWNPVELQIDSMSPPQINGKNATVTVKYHYRAKGTPNMATNPVPEGQKLFLGGKESETLQLRFEKAVAAPYDNVWKIVAPEVEPQGEKDAPPLLSYFAFHVAQKPLSDENRPTQKSLDNLKQLALATRQFTQDYDEHFEFAPEYVREALFPYVKDNAPFFLPGTYEPYTFNANLSGRYISDFDQFEMKREGVTRADNPNDLPYLKNTNKIPMFYEGHDQKPVFRYNGQAAICFADGKVALVTPDEAKTLIWNP